MLRLLEGGGVPSAEAPPVELEVVATHDITITPRLGRLLAKLAKRQLENERLGVGPRPARTGNAA